MHLRFSTIKNKTALLPNGKYKAIAYNPNTKKTITLGHFENEHEADNAVMLFYNDFYSKKENQHYLPKGVFGNFDKDRNKPRFSLFIKDPENSDKTICLRSSYNLYEIIEFRLNIIHSLIDDLQ